MHMRPPARVREEQPQMGLAIASIIQLLPFLSVCPGFFAHINSHNRLFQETMTGPELQIN